MGIQDEGLRALERVVDKLEEISKVTGGTNVRADIKKARREIAAFKKWKTQRGHPL